MIPEEPDIMITSDTLNDNSEAFKRLGLFVLELLSQLDSIPPENRTSSWALDFLDDSAERSKDMHTLPSTDTHLRNMLHRIRDHLHSTVD